MMLLCLWQLALFAPRMTVAWLMLSPQPLAIPEATAMAQVLAVLKSEVPQVMATIKATTVVVLEPLGSIQHFTGSLGSESWRPTRELDLLSRLRR